MDNIDLHWNADSICYFLCKSSKYEISYTAYGHSSMTFAINYNDTLKFMNLFLQFHCIQGILVMRPSGFIIVELLRGSVMAQFQYLCSFAVELKRKLI